MNKLCHTFIFSGLFLLVACSKEPPPVSISQFIENPRLLEATMVRCARNRSETKYAADCLNARDAVNRLNAAREKERGEYLEKQSERKRQALRQTQEAAAEARRRSIEEQRRREEEEYLGNFGEAPEASGDAASTSDAGQPSNNAPAVEMEGAYDASDNLPDETEMPVEPGADLETVQEELKRQRENPE